MTFLRFRNKVLEWLGGRQKIHGINTPEDWAEANYDSILFHWLMKEPLRQIVRLLPDIPQGWIDGLTGSRRTLYEIAKESWYDVDGNAQRKEKLWKPFLYFLVLWENDEILEPADKVLYEMLCRRNEFYINLARQDPANWYMDRNPGLDGSHGRVRNLFAEDPAIRFDSLASRTSFVMLTLPERNFICVRNQEGPVYLVFDRSEFSIEPDGGRRYTVKSCTTDMLTAVQAGVRVEKAAVGSGA